MTIFFSFSCRNGFTNDLIECKADHTPSSNSPSPGTSKKSPAVIMPHHPEPINTITMNRAAPFTPYLRNHSTILMVSNCRSVRFSRHSQHEPNPVPR